MTRNEFAVTNAVDNHIFFKLTSTAVLSVSLTASALIWFYENYRIPLKVVETTIQFKEISEENNKLKTAIEKEKLEHLQTQKKLNQTHLDLGKLNERISSQSFSIKELNQANLFHSDSFYPVGFGNPKIGGPVDNLNTIYTADAIKWTLSDSDWKVKITLIDSYFESVEYDFDEKTRKITGVVFTADSGDDKLLLKRISEIGGKPTQSQRHDIYRWPVTGGVFSFLISGSTYMILSGGMAPAFWKEPSNP